VKNTLFTLIALILSATALAQQAADESIDTTEPDALIAAAPPATPDPFARDSYRVTPVVCPFRGEIDYEPGDIECGLLEVPENREKPDSRYIELHFVKLNSRWDDEEEPEKDDESPYDLAPGKRDDPVVYLTGGPGVQVTGYVKRLKDHGLLDHRDLYILEQRGIGYSADFCPFYSALDPAIDDAATFEEHLEAATRRTVECARRAAAAGVDLTGYSTIENARDVRALRRALGLEQWNVWGISYGSILGQAYIKEDADGIRAVVLDAIMPLEIRGSDHYWRVVHWYVRDLVKMQEICDRQPACAKRYPDMIGRLREAARSVADEPIAVTVKDTENYPSGTARFFSDIVAFLPFTFLYEQANYPGVPGLIYAWADAVEQRDESVFRAIALASGDTGFGGQSAGMSNAIHCIDGGAAAQARAGLMDIAEYPVLGRAIGTERSWQRHAAVCDELGMYQRPADDYLATETDLPSLIVEGDMDPITPPPNARAILPGFRNGTYVEFPFAGHGPTRSVKCGGDMLNAFYDDPSAEPDLACADTMEEPEIFAPLFVSRAAPRLLAIAGEDKKKLALPAAWAGGSLLIVLVAFVGLGLAPLARRLDGRWAETTGGARGAAWLASAVSLAAAGILGAAVAVTVKQSPLLPLLGFVPWARWGAWAGVLAGLMGLLTVILSLRLWRDQRGPALGFLLTGLGAVGLSAFFIYWDLAPF
jgi:pimeloyl-ACP methyl ester carboxylesterase